MKEIDNIDESVKKYKEFLDAEFASYWERVSSSQNSQHSQNALFPDGNSLSELYDRK